MRTGHAGGVGGLHGGAASAGVAAVVGDLVRTSFVEVDGAACDDTKG